MSLGSFNNFFKKLCLQTAYINIYVWTEFGIK